jgi:SM-20-related protein
MQKLHSQLEKIIHHLSEHGYAICEDFLPENLILALASEAQKRCLNNELSAAKTGKTANTHNAAIRGDSIVWLDENDLDASIQAYFSHMHTLKAALNEHLFMNVQELETHFAHYPIGAAYAKHLDQFQHGVQGATQARQLSSVLYLNRAWQASDGGELRLYLNEQEHIEIAPTAGKLVLFLSAKFWHEVLPATRERISLTGWFRARSKVF